MDRGQGARACGARPFSYQDASGGASREGLLVVSLGVHGALRVAAYVNRCPHAGYGLNVADEQVCDPSGRWLMCMVHGALFRPEDGVCVRGPALGTRLASLPARVDGDEVVITWAPRSHPAMCEEGEEGEG